MDGTSGDVIIEAVYENHPVKGELTIVKKGEVLDGFKDDFTYQTENLEGAEFEIYAAEDIYTADFQKDDNGNRILEYATGTLVKTVTTDKDGKAVLKNLPLGSYKIVEKTAPDGFVLNSEAQTVTFSYKDQETPVIEQTAIFENDRQKVEISVVKQDADTEKAVAGAEFGLYAKNDMKAHGAVIVKADTLLGKAVSGEDGKAVFTQDLPFGEYYIKELVAPDGYVSSDEVLEVKAEYQGQDVKVVQLSSVFKNQPTKVVVSKSDLTTGVELSGATLTVLDKDGNVVDTWKSVKGEQHLIERLTVGENYILREEMAPYGYLKAEEITFTIEDTGEIQKVEMKDDVPTGTIIINKNGEFLDKVTALDSVGGWIKHLFQYVTGSLKDVTFEVYALEDVKSADGESEDYYKKDELVATITTDDTGIAKISGLPLGKYYVKEKATVDGFVLDNEAREIDLTYRDQDIAEVTYSADWQNNRQKAEVEVVKKEKDSDRVLEGAVFALCAKDDITGADGKVILKADTVIEELATDKEGKLTFTADLPIGFAYYIKETSPAPGFATTDETQEFTFEYDGAEKEKVSYKNLPEQIEEFSHPDDWWLDEEDSDDGLPVFDSDEAEDYTKGRQRLTGVPMVTGYEALERHRGVRRPRRKLSRREKRAWKKAQKYELKLHKAHEKEERKLAKQAAKQAAREEKAAQKQAKKAEKHKKKTKPPGSVKSSGKKGTGKQISSTNKDNRNKGKNITAQQSIPYREMGKDGICRVEDGYYSKTIRFYDINYQLAQNEDKNAIFENWCDFLNYFDSTIHFQLSFINHHSNMTEYEDVIRIKKQNDSFDDLRMEFAQMLRNQLAKGNNGLVRTKYITFGIEADNIREAKPKLERIETDILNNFKVFGVSAYPLNGVERLQIMYETFNQNVKVPFKFSYDDMLRTGLNTKDYIAPSSFLFKNGKDFQMGDTIGAVSYLQILAPELTDKMLAEFLEMDCNLLVNLHIQSIDQMKAIKLVKSKVTDINRMKIEEQKKAVRSGYDMDIIPSDLNTYGGEAKRLLEDLQSRNERMFLVTLVFLNTAKNKQELENVVFQTAGIAQKYNCALKRLDYQQEQGLMSSLPLGRNWIPIKRALTTTSTAIFVPFTTQELFMGGESIYYGLNALSNNLIMADRKKLKNPNGLILGTPGSGKSFAAKREITNVFIVTKDDIIICDPEGEYFPLVRAFNGQVIRISPTSHDYINPMDININYADDDDPLSLKSDFILSLCELVVGGKNGLEPVEKTIIDRCVRLVYQDYLADPVPEKMPILEDLYNLLRKQEETESQRLATALEIYVNGSLKVFNHRTNVELNNRLVCFDIKDLGKQLKKLGMLIVQDQVWNRVTVNRSAHKSTRYYIDEFHLLLKEEQTAAYSVEIWKRFRKWGGIPTGITQNVKDLLASREIENIFENSDFILMLNQASGDRQILAKQLNISTHQLSYVTNSGEGEGLIFYGNTIIPFKDRFDNTLMLYALMSSKPEDVEKREKLGIKGRDDS
ncbi:VirB4-like conjugal transfer ATPase, CD1110 family [Blautia difficilis]